MVENIFNSTYRALVGLYIFGSGGGGQENYVMFGNNYWWLSNNILGRWNQWDSLCIGINLETPSLVLYHNGKMYDENVFEDAGEKVQSDGLFTYGASIS